MKWSRAYLVLMLALGSCTRSAAEWTNAGNVELTAGNPEAALRAYQSAQASSPNQPEPYLNAASVYAALDDIPRAQQAMDQVSAAVDPRTIAHAYYNLGNVYFMGERYDLAVAAYQEALLRIPSDADARYNLELALQRMTLTPPPAASGTPTPQQPSGDQAAIATATPMPESNGGAELQDAQAMTEAEAQTLLNSLGSSFQPLSLTMTPSNDESVEQDW